MRYRSVRSSTIHAVGHDAASGTLGVIFRGGATYHYAGVPRAHYLALTSRTIASPGRYFHLNVRGRYESKKLGSSDEEPRVEAPRQTKDTCPRCGGAWGKIAGVARCRGCGYAPDLTPSAPGARPVDDRGRQVTGITEDFGHSGMADGGPLRDLFERCLRGDGGDL